MAAHAVALAGGRPMNRRLIVLRDSLGRNVEVIVDYHVPRVVLPVIAPGGIKNINYNWNGETNVQGLPVHRSAEPHPFVMGRRFGHGQMVKL